MNTKVRIIHQPWGGQFKHLYIQVLDKRYPTSNLGTLQVIGTIAFQADKTHDHWYAMKVEVSTDSVLVMTKIVRVLRQIRGAVDQQPSGILKAIGAEEHQYIDGSFVSIKYDGQLSYQIFDRQQHYTNVIAKNEFQAWRKFKRHNPRKYEQDRHVLSIGAYPKLVSIVPEPLHIFNEGDLVGV